MRIFLRSADVSLSLRESAGVDDRSVGGRRKSRTGGDEDELSREQAELGSSEHAGPVCTAGLGPASHPRGNRKSEVTEHKVELGCHFFFLTSLLTASEMVQKNTWMRETCLRSWYQTNPKFYSFNTGYACALFI